MLNKESKQRLNFKMSVQAFDILFSGNLSSLLREEHHSSTSVSLFEILTTISESCNQ